MKRLSVRTRGNNNQFSKLMQTQHTHRANGNHNDLKDDDSLELTRERSFVDGDRDIFDLLADVAFERKVQESNI